MQVITSSKVKSISGKLDPYTGYYLQARLNTYGKAKIFSYRKRGYVPPDGHWRFILMCAELAHSGLYATDIVVDGNELYYALLEAHLWVAAGSVKKYMTYNFHHIINLKTTFGL